eukprot:5958016-Amphidinium_carterae.1
MPFLRVMGRESYHCQRSAGYTEDRSLDGLSTAKEGSLCPGVRSYPTLWTTHMFEDDNFGREERYYVAKVFGFPTQ